MTTEIRELTGRAELLRARPVMTELRTHLDETAYLEHLDDMLADGYRMFALEVDGDIQALAGIVIRRNFYYDRYLYVHDLITTEGARSRGYGEALLSYLEELARAEGCQTLALCSGVQRADAHRFYEDKIGMKRVSYEFKKNL